MSSVIQEILIAQGKTLSTAESCTSGRIAAEITSVAGSSAYFQGGLIAYQDEVKIKMLGVKAEIIDTYDVVSEEVALAMAKGLVVGGIAKNVLLLTGETYTKYINPMDKSVRTIFGDGATSLVVSKFEGKLGPMMSEEEYNRTHEAA